MILAIRFWLLGLATALLCQPAGAVTVRLRVVGTFSESYGNSPPVGSPFTILFSYKTDSPPTTVFPDLRFWELADRGHNFAFSSAGHSLATNKLRYNLLSQPFYCPETAIGNYCQSTSFQTSASSLSVPYVTVSFLAINRNLPLGWQMPAVFPKATMWDRITVVYSSAEGSVALNRGFGATVSQVPEPDTWLLLVSGFAVTGLAARRKATRNCVSA